MMNRLRLFALIAAVLSAISPLVSAYSFTPTELLDRDVAIAAAAEVTAERFPNSDTVLIDRYSYIRYRQDGTYVEWDDNYVKILTEKGKRDWQTIASYFTIPYNTTAFQTVEIIKPDGTIIPIDHESMSREVINRSQMGSNIYNPNSRILQVSVPGLEVGDLLHYVLFDDFVTTRVPDTWSDYVVFESTAPIQRKIYEVWAPAELPLQKVVLYSPVEGTITHTQSEKTVPGADGEMEQLIQYRWVARNVPRMFPEPSMPAMHTVVQRLLVSTIRDWETVSSWYWNLSKPHLEAISPEMTAKVKELVAGLPDDDAKIHAIFYWVSQNIRYLGITTETTAPGYEPHPVDECFAQRHGVCRDKAALLVTMLRLAGFEAFPVLIHNGPKKDPEVPAPFFNHAITAVQMPDGEYLLMDSTDENTKQLLPSYLNNQSYLVAKPEGETLRTSPIVPAEENLMNIETTGRLNTDGNWIAESTLHFDGINDNAYRAYFSRVKPFERRQLFEGRLKDAAVGARILDFQMQPDNMLDTSQPLQVKISWQAPQLPILAENTLMLPVPMIGTGIGMVNFVLGQTGLEQRRYPLRTEIACGVRETVTIDIGDAVGELITLPQYSEIDNENLTRKQSLNLQNGELRIESEFLLKSVEFSPAQYAQLKHVLKTMEFDNRKMPIFRSPEANIPARETTVDVEILDVNNTYDIIDDQTWTETRRVQTKILTYAGIKTNSDLHFNYNEGWEEVELTEGKVTAPDGSVKTISQEEINLMDAAWLGQAPRYPAGRSLVVSLPGVEIGSVIEYTVVSRHHNRPFFAATEYFRATEPLNRKKIRVILPDSMKLAILKNDDGMAAQPRQSNLPMPTVSELQKRLNQKHVYEWTVADVAAIRNENQLPPWWTFNPTLFITTGDWQTYAAEVRKTLVAAAAAQTAVQAKAVELTSGVTSESDKIRILRDFVAENVRAAGPSFAGLPLSAVTNADRTLADGYGNTTDRAVLLYALLTAADFQPEFVLAANNPDIASLRKPLNDIADPAWFRAVLVRVPNGLQHIYLNDTDQYDHLGATAHHGKVGFSLTSAAFQTIEATAGSRDAVETAYKIDLRADGSASVTKQQQFYGMAYGSSKKKFAEMPPEQRNRYFQEMTAALSQRAAAVGDLDTSFASYPGTVTFTAEIDQLAVKDGQYLYFNLFDTLQSLLRLRADERHNPIYWPRAQDLNLTYEISFPSDYEIALPVLPAAGEPKQGERKTILTWNAPDQAGTVSVIPSRSKDGKLYLLYSVRLRPAFLPASRYPELQEIDRQLAHPATNTILLRKVEAESL